MLNKKACVGHEQTGCKLEECARILQKESLLLA